MSSRDDATLRSAECLDEQAAVDLVRGVLSPERLAVAEAHLDRCHDCRQTVALLAAQSSGDTLPVVRPDEGLLPEGTVVGRYRLERPLGRGGMGVVYEAHDPELDRNLCIKFLRRARDLRDLGNQQTRALREAQALARLAHPNVIAIYDVGMFQGEVFIAMELAPSGTLSEWLAQEQRSWHAVYDKFIEAGRGLAAVHAAGLVHRDFKPQNVMLSADGRVRIADFGLARGESSGEARLFDATSGPPRAPSALSPLDATVTGTDVAVGTPRYMAPEQLSGARADFRSDQFSFCLAFYEALGGQRAAVIAQPMRSRLVAPSTRSIPAWLLKTLTRGLADDPEARFASITALLETLQLEQRSVRARRGTVAVLSLGVVIAVLAATLALRPPRPAAPAIGGRAAVLVADVVNDSADPELASLSGIISAALEQSRRLSVVSRAHALDVLRELDAGTNFEIDQSAARAVCHHEACAYLATVHVAKLGELYSLELQLIDASTGEVRATITDGAPRKTDIPAAFTRMGGALRRRLNEDTGGADAPTARAEPVTTENLEAYRHFYAGEQLLLRLGFTDAIAELRQAVAIDPDFALANYRLAYALSWSGYETGAKEVQAALSHSERLSEKNLMLASALAAQIDGDSRAALGFYQRGVALDPKDPEATFGVADMSFHLDALADAEKYLNEALRLDPRSERALQHLFWLYTAQDRDDDALRTGRRWLAQSAGETAPYAVLPLLLRKGYEQEAFAAIEHLGLTNVALGGLLRAEALALLGRPKEAESAFKAVTRAPFDEMYQVLASTYLAWFYLRVGSVQQAEAELQRVDARPGLVGNALVMRRRLGMLALLAALRSDAKGAHAFAEQAMAVPSGEAAELKHLLFQTWLELGDFARARALVRAPAPDLYAEALVDGLELAAAGNCRAALAPLERSARAAERLRIVGRYALARCQFELGDSTAALAGLERLTHPAAYGLRTFQSVYLARELLLAARIHGARGEVAARRRTYQALIDNWAFSPANRPELVEARAALSPEGTAGH